MKNKKSISILLILLLCINMLPTRNLFAKEEQNVIKITSVEDLIALSQNCRLDSWSQGKTIILQNDLNVAESDFLYIPTFGGTFEGGNYTISGYVMDQEESDIGFFCYIQEGARVENLTIEGSVTPAGTQQNVGGVVGINYGTLMNVVYQGTVESQTNVGGIAGCNEESGSIVGCSMSGTVQGEHYTGGIVGQNIGTVSECVNTAKVNTVNEEQGLSIEDISIDLTKLNSSENVNTTTDTGGIAGMSKGTINECTNKGNVGYEHVGYNVGGITGRSNGYLIACENEGEVLGRKDVGGIAGQLEPEILLDFGGSIKQEMDKLESLVNQTIDDCNALTTLMTTHSDKILKSSEQINQNSSLLIDEMTTWTNGNIGEMNAAIDKFSNASGDLSDEIDHIQDITEDTKSSVEDMTDSVTDLQNQLNNVQDAQQDTTTQINESAAEAVALEDSPSTVDVSTIPTSQDDVQQAIDDVTQQVVNDTTQQVIDDATQAAIDMATQQAEAIKKSAESATSQVSSLEGTIADYEDALKEISDIMSDLANSESNKANPLSDNVNTYSDRITTDVASILQEATQMNQEMISSSEKITNDARAINAQVKVIVNLIDSEINNINNPDVIKYYEDLSEEEITTTTNGKTYACTNAGMIQADINVGGIAGSMSIEYDIDPEEDITTEGSLSSSAEYNVKVIVQDCINKGTVTSKKDCAGGIAGLMDFGFITNCENYGNIDSESGDYVGGIAGQSTATIHGSFSKCRLSGSQYVAGIAGYGKNINNSYAFVLIEDADQNAASIAGKIAENGTLENNYFVDNGQTGIDKVSYQGMAEPVALESLIGREDIPDRFEQITATFLVDHRIIKTITVAYEDGIEESELPQIPEKDGYYATWNTTELSNLTFDEVLEAQYEKYITTLSSEQTRDNEQSIILVEGNFVEGNALLCESMASGIEMPEHAVDAWKVTIPEDKQQNHTIWYQPEESGTDLVIMIEANGQWEKIDSKMVGKYVCFTVSQSEVNFTVVEIESQTMKYIMIGIMAGIGLLGCLIIIKNLKKRLKWRKKS